jgi:GntR family transcriptional regulator
MEIGSPRNFCLAKWLRLMSWANELGVSQGAVRKALNQMVGETLLARRQSKGTFVAEHTQEDSLFGFFRIREPNGESLVLVTEVLPVARRQASDEEASHLQQENGSAGVELVRLGKLYDQTTILETVILALFNSRCRNNLA